MEETVAGQEAVVVVDHVVARLIDWSEEVHRTTRDDNESVCCRGFVVEYELYMYGTGLVGLGLWADVNENGENIPVGGS